VVFLGDRPTLLQMAGGAAILIGLTLLLRTAPVPADATAGDPAGLGRDHARHHRADR
jgi:drug/metabolite transporter (DMT)-like permease